MQNAKTGHTKEKLFSHLLQNRSFELNYNERYLAAKRVLFDKVYAELLNPEQREAVFCARGPLLVLAGAGTGKTTVLVNRIAYLIKYGNAYNSDIVPDGITEEAVSALERAASLPVEEIAEILPEFIFEPTPPWSILAITFTNKAAREIKDRISLAIDDPDASSSIWAGTFHSVCLRMLRRFGERIGYTEGFSIYDTDDKKRMISTCQKDLNIDEKRLSPRAVGELISRAKDKLESAEDFKVDSDPRSRDVKDIYTLYEKRMRENNALDFDDIIVGAVRLLREHADVREYYQNKFRQVLVDEYQDTNRAQFVLTALLADKHRNIMVVGDDDQSIYRFRGATVENILDFDKTYPDAKVIRLEQNYRSTETILEAANAVIKHNGKRHQKSLWSKRGKGSPILLHEAEDQSAEGKYIVDKIIGGIYKEKKKYSDYAVLYRVNALGRSLQTAFAKSGVPFKVVGDLGFYDRKEVKDMLAYLSVLSSSRDSLRLKRIINEPKRKIGAATVEAIEQIAAAEGRSMLEVIERAGDYQALAKSREKLLDFAAMLAEVRTDAHLPSEMISEVFDRSGYREMLRAEGFEGETRTENVEELISAAVEYEKKCAESALEPTLSGFLEEVALVSDIDKFDETADAVVLMTVHAAKGLEFPTVFIAGMEEGIFPSEHVNDDPAELDEERRLTYVAITRAKDSLHVTYARTRTMYGKTTYGRLSRFVREEIPRFLVETERPKSAPPKSCETPYKRQPQGYRRETVSEEFRRTPDILGAKKRAGASSFGVEKFAPGTRVKHDLFDTGTIVSAKDMGGDVLYTVRFDNGQEKRLMATFAKLKKL